MCDSYIKSTRYHADSFFSKYYASALRVEMSEVNSLSNSKAEHIESIFGPKTCLGLVLQHFYKINLIMDACII